MNGNMISYNNLSDDKKILYWVALTSVEGWGPSVIRNLFKKYGSLYNILEQIENKNPDIINIEKAYNTIFVDNCHIAKNIIDITNSCGAKIVTLGSNLYPANIRNIPAIPPVLYYKGSLDLISIKSLAVVGTTNPTEQGLLNAKRFANYCVRNDIQVISGLARGIDTAAHETTLECNGITYAVIGHGIDYTYPSENKNLYEKIEKNGAVISQFPTGNKPNKWQFPMRNELMCTLASGTVIIEATNNCGSVVQADFSFKHNRRVYVLHNNINSQSDDFKWANELVKRGAVVVKSFKDVKVVLPKEIDKLQNQILNGETANGQQNLLSLENINYTNKTILFDLDGVIVDSFESMKKAYIRVINELSNIVIDESKLNIILKQSPFNIFKKFKVDTKIGNRLFKKYFSEYLNSPKFIPKIGNIIKQLKDKGFKIGIVTSQPSSRYKKIMKKANFSKYIDIAITWNDIPRGKCKPSPDGITIALKKLNATPAEAFYIGDTTIDIQAAKNANVKSVAVLWGIDSYNQLSSENPDYIFNDVIELKRLII